MKDVVTINSTPVLVGRALSVMGSLSDTAAAMLGSGPKMKMLKESLEIHRSFLESAKGKVSSQAMLCHEEGWVAISLEEVDRLEVFPAAYLASRDDLCRLYLELDVARAGAEKRHEEARARFYTSVKMAGQATLGALTIGGALGAGAYLLLQESQAPKPAPMPIPGVSPSDSRGTSGGNGGTGRPLGQPLRLNDDKRSDASTPESAGKGKAAPLPAAATAVVVPSQQRTEDPQPSSIAPEARAGRKLKETSSTEASLVSQINSMSQKAIPPTPQEAALPAQAKVELKSEPKPRAKDPGAQKVETASQNAAPSIPPAPQVAALPPAPPATPKTGPTAQIQDLVVPKGDALSQKPTPPAQPLPQVAKLEARPKQETQPKDTEPSALQAEPLSPKPVVSRQAQTDPEKSQAEESLSPIDQGKLRRGLSSLSDALRAFGDNPPQIEIGTVKRSRETIEAFRHALLQRRPESMEQKILVGAAERLLTEDISRQSLDRFEAVVVSANRQSGEINPIEPGASGWHLQPEQIQSNFADEMRIIGAILLHNGANEPLCKAGSSKEMHETLEAYVAAIERLGKKAPLSHGEQLISCLEILQKRGVTSASLEAYKRSLNLRASLPRFTALRKALDAGKAEPWPRLQRVSMPGLAATEKTEVDAEMQRKAAQSQQVARDALRVIPSSVLAPQSLKPFDSLGPTEIQSELQRVFFALYHPKVSRFGRAHASAVSRELDVWRTVIARQKQPATAPKR